MKFVVILALMCGFSSGAIQPRSPVYRSAVYATPVNGQTSMVNEPMNEQQSSAANAFPHQPAQARQGQVAPQGAVTSDTGYVPPIHSVGEQNNGASAYVLYLPENPPPGFWRMDNWREIGLGGSSIALFVGGSYLLYDWYAKDAKRTFRQLREMNLDDAAQMARRVLLAIENFHEKNTKDNE